MCQWFVLEFYFPEHDLCMSEWVGDALRGRQVWQWCECEYVLIEGNAHRLCLFPSFQTKTQSLTGMYCSSFFFLNQQMRVIHGVSVYFGLRFSLHKENDCLTDSTWGEQAVQRRQPFIHGPDLQEPVFNQQSHLQKKRHTRTHAVTAMLLFFILKCSLARCKNIITLQLTLPV